MLIQCLWGTNAGHVDNVTDEHGAAMIKAGNAKLIVPAEEGVEEPRQRTQVATSRRRDAE
jgi:hypothetical protein